jgi:tryptophan synthase alpha chain
MCGVGPIRFALPMDGPQRIADAFAEASGQAALMPYLMGGFPDLECSRAIGEAYADGGADLVELGVPFSDPLADGPVIQAAGTRALAAGATVDGVLDVCSTLSARVPVVVMLYVNLVLARGVERFAAALADAGASGVIVPDLPLEEAPAMLAACDAAGVALVPLVAPTTPDSRLAAIGARARGFLYTVSVTGTTGERTAGAGAYGAIIGRAKAHTDVPVALGFGIGTPEQAAQAAAEGADGVIIGSRLVREVAESEDPPAAARVLVAAFAAGLHRGVTTEPHER